MKRSAENSSLIGDAQDRGGRTKSKRVKLEQDEVPPTLSVGKTKRSSKDKSEGAEIKKEKKKKKKKKSKREESGLSEEQSETRDNSNLGGSNGHEQEDAQIDLPAKLKKRKRNADEAAPHQDSSKDESAVSGKIEKAGKKKRKQLEKEKAVEEAIVEKVQSDESALSGKIEKADKKKKKHLDKERAVGETSVQKVQSDEPSKDDAQPEDTGTKARFIVFIGNLPFTATKVAVYKHFSALQPTDVRLLTERNNPAKSRGIAFVEFARFDHMKTCLAKFHHSDFNDGMSPARKINVELTAGGGGKKDNRKQKITQKNSKLDEERARRMQEEEKAKKEKTEARQAQGQETTGTEKRDSVHPSRRGRVPQHKR